MSDPVARLLADLVEATLGVGRSKRVRLAVTAAEYECVRQYCLARDGRFYGRIRNLPLVIEESPTNPLFWFEERGADNPPSRE